MPTAPDGQPAANAPPLIAVVGLTASGKSEWALEIARRLAGEIVSIDSRQVYRRLDIGTAKPSAAMQAEIPHWCIDLVEPEARYSLAEYLRAARAAIADIQSRGKRAIVVGGSGQHMRALLEGWVVPPAAPDLGYRASLAERSAAQLYAALREVDPTAAEQIGPTNARRLIRALEVHHVSGRPISEWQRRREPLRYRAVAPDVPLAALDRRIAERTRAMFAAGFVDEVRALLDAGVPSTAPGFDAIGYREVLALLRGELTEREAEAAVAQQTRRFARRQQRWFRRDDPTICWAAAAPLAMLE